jgi:hypothetical protein
VDKWDAEYKGAPLQARLDLTVLPIARHSCVSFINIIVIGVIFYLYYFRYNSFDLKACRFVAAK